jgi:TnpA family transposase
MSFPPLVIEEIYTDTAGFTDHVFALCHVLGTRFAPRIRDLPDKKLYTLEPSATYTALTAIIGSKSNVRVIEKHWDNVLRLACSIKSGVTTASLLIRKIAAQHTSLSIALRELGRIERTLFILDYLEQPKLRLKILMGLNKGEARNALAKAVFFYRRGELLDRTWEQQSNSASGFNLVVAAIILWNTVYLAKAIAYLREQQLSYLSRGHCMFLPIFCRSRLPPLLMFHHRIENRQQLAHTRGQGHFFLFAHRQQALIELANHGIMTRSHQG